MHSQRQDQGLNPGSVVSGAQRHGRTTTPPASPMCDIAKRLICCAPATMGVEFSLCLKVAVITLSETCHMGSYTFYFMPVHKNLF